MLGLKHGGVTYVDYALELPGLFYVRRGGDAEASRRPHRLAVDSFFLSQHDHGGGTFKYYGPSSEFKRAHQIVSNRKPASAQGLTYRALAREVAKYQRPPTLPELHYLRAPILKSATLYHGDHHRTAPILSNSLSETLDGNLAHMEELREAQREVGAVIDEHSPDAPAFTMRWEPRFFGCGIEEALLEDPADEVNGETRAEAAIELMQNLTSIFFWYMLELWDLELAHVPEISALELIAPSSFHLAMAEATLALAVQEFSVNSATTSLSHLALDAHLRVQGHICKARGTLFCSSPLEAAFIQATSHLDALASGARDLQRSQGSLRAEARAKRAVAAQARQEADAAADAMVVRAPPQQRRAPLRQRRRPRPSTLSAPSMLPSRRCAPPPRGAAGEPNCRRALAPCASSGWRWPSRSPLRSSCAP